MRIAQDAGLPDSDVFDAAQPVPDAGQPAPDAGPIDTGPTDAGPRCLRPTANGGCACSSRSPAPGPYQQDDCPDPRELCVPWDNLSGRQDVLGPFQRCARPCESDSDCESQELCAVSSAPPGSGAHRICMDRRASVDRLCSNTRAVAREAVVADAPPQAPGVRIGCEEGLECVLNIREDLHVDEGACVVRCLSDAECGGSTPYCNPNLLPAADGRTGVCSQARRSRGSVCASAIDGRLGITNQCDTSAATPPATVCVRVQGLLEGEQGICMTSCETDLQCPSESGQAGVCNLFGGSLGLCVDSCSNNPDSCEGPGSDGVGRVCMNYLGDGNGNTIGLCMDRKAPPIQPARLDSFGMVIDMGDNCFDAGGSDRFLQCPEASSCVIVDFNTGIGLCLFGCAEGQPEGNATCEQQLGAGATCVSVSAGPQASGFCADP